MTNHTKIICTLGPASRRPEVLREMVEAGMDFARLNFSHGRPKDHQKAAAGVRTAADAAGREIRLIQDLEGPKMRIGELSHALHFRTGDKTRLVRESREAQDIPVPDPRILGAIKPGDRLFLDDGAVELEALEAFEERIHAVVRTGGRIDSRSGLQIPGRRFNLPGLSEKDLADIEIGRGLKVDFVAQSMVRNRGSIAELKSRLGEGTPIIAKIESAEALEDLKGIAEESWGMMVARGDLGVSIPRAEVPLWQKEILEICKGRSRFGIVATEMLLSMVKNRRPTRAEVSDVATAILDGANAVMLSEETAVGDHPAEAVREIRTIIETVERSRWFVPP